MSCCSGLAPCRHAIPAIVLETSEISYIHNNVEARMCLVCEHERVCTGSGRNSDHAGMLSLLCSDTTGEKIYYITPGHVCEHSYSIPPYGYQDSRY